MSRLGDLGHKLYAGEVSYDFVGRRRRWYVVSAIIIIVAVGALLFRGLNLGIEFKGGAEFGVPNATCSVESARSTAERVAGGQAIVTQTGNGTIRVQTEPVDTATATQVAAALAADCGVAAGDVKIQVVGPSWGGEITQKALQGLVVFLILVAIFLSIYFEWRMAIAALVALAHDLVITIGIYALTGLEVTPATVIGVLTILGYSLYDTVVVFDKVKENTRGIAGQSRMTYSEAANLAMNQTLVRSINTSIVALLPVIAIIIVGAGFLGAGTLLDLAVALAIGMAAGAYSSIFIATPFLCQLKEREPEMQALAKRVQARRAGVTSGVRGRKQAAAGGSGATAVDVLDDAAETAAPVNPARPVTTVQTGPRNQPRKTSKSKRK